jgi:hypothetical protein
VSWTQASPLHRALALSRELVAVAETADAAAALRLDGERMAALKEARRRLLPVDDSDREILREIMALNQRAIGLLQHSQRAKARDLDMVSVGRRALRAYSSTRPHR